MNVHAKEQIIGGFFALKMLRERLAGPHLALIGLVFKHKFAHFNISYYFCIGLADTAAEPLSYEICFYRL